MIRRRDGEYRLREYDPETVHRLAIELLQAFAKDPGAAQIADLDVYLPDIRWLAASDSERDDLTDAIYEACGRAVIAVPPRYGHLVDAETGAAIGPATDAQQQASYRAGDGGVFLIDRDGDPIDVSDTNETWTEPTRRVYVES